MRAAVGSIQAPVRQAAVAAALVKVCSALRGTAWLGQLAGPALLATPAADHASAMG